MLCSFTCTRQASLHPTWRSSWKFDWYIPSCHSVKQQNEKHDLVSFTVRSFIRTFKQLIFYNVFCLLCHTRTLYTSHYCALTKNATEPVFDLILIKRSRETHVWSCALSLILASQTQTTDNHLKTLPKCQILRNTVFCCRELPASRRLLSFLSSISKLSINF